MRLLEEQKRRLEMAIKIADDFKASDATPIVSAGPQSEQGKMSEEELAAALEKDEAELAGLQKQVDDAKKELGDVRAQIAAKKGESPPELRADALKDVPTNAAAEKWLEENFSGIHKSIAEQGERLQAILAEADKCEQSVSRSARLRTRRLNCKVSGYRDAGSAGASPSTSRCSRSWHVTQKHCA